MENIVEIYKLNDVTIEIAATPSGYDVIFRRDNITRHIMQNVELSSAYAFVAGFMYDRVKFMELTSNSLGVLSLWN